MDGVSLSDVRLTPLRRVAAPGGDVLHALKRDDVGWTGFGEAYFSTIEPGKVKAWKLHRHMTMNVVVPVGIVRFVFHLPNLGFRTEEIGPDRYARLTVPPGIWFGFQCRSSAYAVVLNIADLPHDPTEVDRLAPNHFFYDWTAP
jgi:dTDP-4-dehydrorhamnose 3,5-epimerase